MDKQEVPDQAACADSMWNLFAARMVKPDKLPKIMLRSFQDRDVLYWPSIPACPVQQLSLAGPTELAVTSSRMGNDSMPGKIASRSGSRRNARLCATATFLMLQPSRREQSQPEYRSSIDRTKTKRSRGASRVTASIASYLCVSYWPASHKSRVALRADAGDTINTPTDRLGVILHALAAPSHL